MDASAFDALSRVLSLPDTRRRALGVLAVFPLLGGLAGWLAPEQGAAKDRRRRRKLRHKRRKGNRKRKHGCRPRGKGKVCAGRCGPVKSRQTCGKTVDCGSCACPAPCDECFICQGGPNTPGACVPDPEQAGEPCGRAGQVCQADGACACSAGTCANPTPVCVDGVCSVCSATNPCPPTACCQGDGTCKACPACQVCDSGACVPDDTLQHTCGGPCPGGEWCDGGACAAIQATVTLPDCSSLCGGSLSLCGQTVTCPSCSQCLAQTGCSSQIPLDGPAGPGVYCGIANTTVCNANADCAASAPYSYCTVSATPRCATICGLQS
ncbi:MAG: hypothetical protein R2853_21000 [Thermomicrobiales bacterium]